MIDGIKLEDHFTHTLYSKSSLIVLPIEKSEHDHDRSEEGEKRPANKLSEIAYVVGAYTIVGIVTMMIHAITASSASTTVMNKLVFLDNAALHAGHLFVFDLALC